MSASAWSRALRLVVVCAFCTFALSPLARVASALTSFTEATADVRSGQGTITTNCSQINKLAIPTTATCQDIQFPSGPNGSGTAFSSAGFGSLHAQSFVGTAAGTGGASLAEASAAFHDVLTLSSSTCGTCLFSGTIEAHGSIDGAVMTQGGLNGSAFGNFTISFGPSYQGGAGITTSGSSASNTFTVQAPYTFGQTVVIDGVLTVNSTLSGGFTIGVSQADFWNTARLTSLALLDANGQPMPDIVFTSDSGTVYPSAVPEPSTLALLGSAAFEAVVLEEAWRRRA